LTDENEPSSESELMSTTESELSEKKGVGGAIALAMGAILAVGGGILKHSDGLWKPLLKRGDELAKSAGRHVDDGSIPGGGPNVDGFGRLATGHSDETMSDNGDDALNILWDVAGEGAKSLGSLKSGTGYPPPRGNNGPSGKATSYDVEVVSRELKQSYRQRDDGAYHITETFCLQTMVTTRNGMKESTDEEIDRQLPDEGRGEYTRVELRRYGDTTLLREKSRTLLGKYNLDFDFESEVEFEKGNWTELEAGNQVVLRYSDKSREMILKTCQEQMAAQMHQIASQSPNIAISAMNFLEVPQSSFVFHGKELQKTTRGSERLLLKMLRRK
jgi:hypothetical protein